MDLSNDDFDYKEHDDCIFKEFITWRDLEIDDDEDAEMMVVMSTQEELDKKEEHVVNFKGSMPVG